ncbi:hypothetical protein BCR33DRAFT_800476 [Rhizoclosmatium globosum]|uniref:Helitron helicase-like domain-containing protein n=1 Tax=Rhizoclosmatium globosum TaxID=329046 RepID=A0A1Y1ZR61_9FUNG|nr:hypothetical protein BCR33DRAFT_800476 [Rhizoclosmatium globosum]|eukprot:ORY12487.1 hypothetical protein BCR33DRAFT_800476 [Rhizoclosmatium globosum]
MPPKSKRTAAATTARRGQSAPPTIGRVEVAEAPSLDQAEATTAVAPTKSLGEFPLQPPNNSAVNSSPMIIEPQTPALSTDTQATVNFNPQAVNNRGRQESIDIDVSAANLGSQIIDGRRSSSRFASIQPIMPPPIQSATAIKTARSRSLQTNTQKVDIQQQNTLSRSSARELLSAAVKTENRQQDTLSRSSARKILPAAVQTDTRQQNTESRQTARTALPETEKERIKRVNRNQQRARREKANEGDLDALPEQFQGYTNNPEKARAYWYSNLDYQTDSEKAFTPISDQEKAAAITEFDTVFSPHLPIYGCSSCGIRIILKKDECVSSFPLSEMDHMSVLELPDDNPTRTYFFFEGRFYQLHQQFLLKLSAADPITKDTQVALCTVCHRSCLKKVPIKKDEAGKNKQSVRGIPSLSVRAGIDYGAANRVNLPQLSYLGIRCLCTVHLMSGIMKLVDTRDRLVLKNHLVAVPTTAYEQTTQRLLAQKSTVFPPGAITVESLDFGIMNGYKHIFQLTKAELVMWAHFISDYGPPDVRGKTVVEAHFDGVDGLPDLLLESADVVSDLNALAMEEMATTTVPGAPSSTILVPETSATEFVLGPLQSVLVETFDASAEQDESIFAKVLKAIRKENEEDSDEEEGIVGMGDQSNADEMDEDGFIPEIEPNLDEQMSEPNPTIPPPIDPALNAAPTANTPASNVFADYPEFGFFFGHLQLQLQTFRGVGNKWRSTPAAMAELTRLLNEGMEAHLENAVNHPKSKDAKLLLSEIGPLIASAGEQVWFSEQRSKKAYSEMIAYVRFFGPTMSYFVTCNPHMDRHLLTYRLCYPVENNWNDPTGLEFNGVPDAFLDRVRLIDRHPMAYAKSFGLLDQAVSDGLLAVPAQKDFDSFSLKPWHLRRRGKFTSPKASPHS